MGLTSSPLTEDEAANKESSVREKLNVSCWLFFLLIHNRLKIATLWGGFLGNAEMERE